MNTLAWLLIIGGILIVRSAANGRGISNIPADLGDLISAALDNDATKIKEVLSRTGDVVDIGSSVPLGEGATIRHKYNLGPVDPRLESVANEVGTKFNLTTIGGYRASDPYPDHPSGKAADFMVGTDKAKGDAIVVYLQQNVERLHVKYLIWYQRSWTPGKGWKDMADRGSDTANHKDHVHLTIT